MYTRSVLPWKSRCFYGSIGTCGGMVGVQGKPRVTREGKVSLRLRPSPLKAKVGDEMTKEATAV